MANLLFHFAGALWLWALLVISFGIAGCAMNRDATQSTKRSKRVDTVTVQQVVVGDKIVKLTTKTSVVENEDTGAVFNERVETEPPQVLQDLGAAAVEAGKKVADRIVPGGGYVVEMVAGLAGLGAGGAGFKALGEARRRRKLEEEKEEAEERQRKIARAMDDYAADIEDATTDDEVRAVKDKHRKRQQALGIHNDIERLRHG